MLTRREFIRLAAAGAMVAGCGPAAPGAPNASSPPVRRGGTLKVALESDVIGIDPHGASAGVDRNVYTSIYNALVAPDPNLNIVPDLAESWTTPDDTTYVFKLRSGVKFHDGTTCDAEAVKWNFDWILDPANASARRAELSDVKDTSVVDPLTLKITTKTPFAPFLAIISDRAGYIVSPAARKKFGKDYTRNPVGTGPFSFVEWAKDDHVTFRRNAGYFERDLPILDEITFRPVPDSSVRVTGLKARDVQFLRTVDAKDVAEIKSTAGLQILEGPGVGFQGLWLQTARGPLASRDLREALAWAVDRDAILKAAYFNVGAVGQGPIAPSLLGFDPNFKPFSRDLQKAKAALARGGRPNGFKLTLKTANESVAVKVSQLVQAQFKEIGVDVDIVQVDFAALLKAGEQGDFDAMTLGWSGRIDPDGNIQNIWHTKGTFNYGKYSGADDLIDRARTTLDRTKRAQLYREVERKIVVDDVAYVFTYFPPALFAASTAVKDFAVGGDGLTRFKRVWLSG